PPHHAAHGIERHPDLWLARHPRAPGPRQRGPRRGGVRPGESALQRASGRRGPDRATAAVHGAAADDCDRDHPALGRGGGAQPWGRLLRALSARAPPAEPTRVGLRRAARVQCVDQRTGDAGSHGRAQNADARQPRLRRGPDLDELALRLGDRGGPADRHRRSNGHLPPDDARPRAARGPAMTRVSLLTVVVLIYLFLLAPLIIVVAVSFDPTDAFRFPPSGVSLRWYAAFFASETFLRAFFRVSLVVAVVVSAMATAVGGLAAIGLVRFLTRGRTLVETFFLAPIVVPEILLCAVALLLSDQDDHVPCRARPGAPAARHSLRRADRRRGTRRHRPVAGRSRPEPGRQSPAGLLEGHGADDPFERPVGSNLRLHR